MPCNGCLPNILTIVKETARKCFEETLYSCRRNRKRIGQKVLEETIAETLPSISASDIKKYEKTRLSLNDREVIVKDQRLICLDANDLHRFLAGKSGIMYQQTKNDDESIHDFMKAFFDDMKSRSQVMESSHYFLHMIISENDFMMEHMELVNDFFSIIDEDKKVMYGMSCCDGDSQMKMTLLCTKEES